MWELDSLGARVRYIQNKVGGSMNLERLTKVSQPQQSRLIRNEIKNPGVQTIQAIAEAGDVTVDWMLGKEEIKTGESAENYLTVTCIDNEDKVSPLLVNRDFLLWTLGVKETEALMYVQNKDDMEPTILKGAVTIVNAKEKTGNGLFLIEMNGERFIRRLENVLTGTDVVNVMCDSKKYKEWFAMNRAEFNIIGQVVWAGSSI